MADAGEGTPDGESDGGEGDDAGAGHGLIDGRYFYVAVIADTHVIDDFYVGPENSPLDTETILHANEHYRSARDRLNAFEPPVDRVFIIGDFIHEYPSADPAFYDANTTAIDIAKEITAGFEMPVHVGLGNHDYDPPQVPRPFTLQLFENRLGLSRTYYAVDRMGWKFIMLDPQLGPTWDETSPVFDDSFGSFGHDQLAWLKAQLDEGKPTIIMHHHPLTFVKLDEEAGELNYGTMLKTYKNIEMVLAGHWHRWFDFGREFGAQHYAVGATRFDEDAYWIFEFDTVSGRFRIVNFDNVALWGSYETDPTPSPLPSGRE